MLWEEYRRDHPEGYGYSQFCERLKTEIGRKDLTLQIHHKPGEVMQVDFAGKKMHWVDVSSGEVHDCEILVAVFPHSQYTFAIALTSQKVGDFIHGLNQALLYFSKLPKIILSDNLKSFVIKADRYDPQFNELCVQLAAHYQIDLQATRVRKPKDKASVENMVGTVYTRIYAPLRNEVFHSLDQLNQSIRHQLALHNTKPYQNREGNRQQVFQTCEQPVMKELPGDLFEAFNAGEIDPVAGEIRSLGGCTEPGADLVGVEPAWARVATLTAAFKTNGGVTLRTGPAGATFGISVFGSFGNLDSARIAFGRLELVLPYPIVGRPPLEENTGGDPGL